MPNPHHCQNASVPQHIYGYVASELLHGLDAAHVGRFEPCVIFGVTSVPSRALLFSVLLESGAQWARIPLHALRHEVSKDGAPRHDLPALQCWDCFDWEFSVTRYDYLREMGCTVRSGVGAIIPAAYWFTLDHTDNGFSLYPSQHKCFHVLLLRDGSGQIAAMPNNRILWRDDSFVKQGQTLDYKTMAPVTWHAEQGHRNPQETAFTKDE